MENDFDSLKEDDNSPGSFDRLQDDSQKYGTGTQLAKTAVEQVLSGATLGLSKVVQTHGIPALGIPAISAPEDVAGREHENPITSFASNVIGTSLGLGAVGRVAKAATLGAAALEEGAVANQAANVAAKGPGLGARLGAATAEGATIGGVNQATDDWSQNKPLDAQKIAASAGIGALIGGGFGGILEGIKYKYGTPLAKSAQPAIQETLESPEGLVKPVISQLDAEAYKAGDFETSIKNSPAIAEEDVPKILEGIKKLKPEAPEIVKASEDIGSPVLEGMISSDKLVQKGEDALLNSPPTYSGIKRQEAYQKVYDAVSNTINNALGTGSEYTKAELGNSFKSSIVEKIKAQVAPINDLYDGIKKYYSVIPLDEEALPKIISDLKNIDSVRISPSSPEGRIANNVINEIGNLKSVDDIKTYNSILTNSLPTNASSGEKRVVSIISDKLSHLEDSSVIDFAQSPNIPDSIRPEVNNLLAQRKAADAAYGPFKESITELAQKLGKGKVHGAQDAIHFITDRVTPEAIVEKLFSKNDSEFLKFFGQKFPEEMGLLRDYQKGIIREQASKGKVFSPDAVFKELQNKKLQPEIRNAIFSPEELSKLKSAEIVHKSLPAGFNPSGTSHVTAFRAFYEHPTGAIIANARDLAIDQYIKAAGGNISGTTIKALKKHVSNTSVRIATGVSGLFRASSGEARKVNE